MPHRIVLAHGVLGFGQPFGNCQTINYFNGVKSFLELLGHSVLVTQVPPIGTIEARGKKLAQQLQQDFDKHGQLLHVIAHSMGGLDARYAITRVFKVARPVSTLITIGTPHLGSPVPDALLRGGGPLFNHIPDLLKSVLNNEAPALGQLTTDYVKKFDAETADVEGVRYIQVAGNGEGASLLFELAAEIGRLTNEVNDGVVTRTSALRPRTARAADAAHQEKHENLVKDWSVDHAGEVGWSSSSPLPIVLPDIPLLELEFLLAGELLPLAEFLKLPTGVVAHLLRYHELVGMLDHRPAAG
jgi:triacylglycerol lipase